MNLRSLISEWFAGWRTFINRDALYLVVESLIYPCLLILATPLLLNRFGEELYGVWVFFLTIVAFNAFVSIGLSNATIKALAESSASPSPGAVRVAATKSVLVATSIAVVTAGGLWCCIYIVRLLDAQIPSVAFRNVDFAIPIFLFWVEIIDLNFTSIMKGLRRIGDAVAFEATQRVLHVTGLLAIAWLAPAPKVLFTYIVVFAALRLLAKFIWVWLSVGFCKIQIRLGEFAEFAKYIGWGALHGAGGLMLFSADRVVVQTEFGVTALALYASALTIPQQLHAITAAGAASAFPRLVSQLGSSPDWAIVRGYGKLAAILGVPFILGTSVASLFSVKLTEMWLGQSLPEQFAAALPTIYIAFGLLGLAVIPHYVFLATGRPGAVAILNVVSGVVSFFVLVTGVGSFGYWAIAWAKVSYAITLYAGYLFFIAFNKRIIK